MGDQNNPTFTPLKSLFVIFEISQFGRVKAIFPVAQNEREEKILEEALDRITRPSCGWLKRLWRSAKEKRVIDG
jgi:hypothetical protein